VASLVARRHDVSTGLLYSWRKKARAQLDRPEFAQAAFLPAVVEEDRAACSASGAKARSTAVIEVVLDRGVRVRIEAGMPVALVAATLKALR
jgi:transposase